MNAVSDSYPMSTSVDQYRLDGYLAPDAHHFVNLRRKITPDCISKDHVYHRLFVTHSTEGNGYHNLKMSWLTGKQAPLRVSEVGMNKLELEDSSSSKLPIKQHLLHAYLKCYKF